MAPNVDALLAMYRLKAQARRGWALRGVGSPESVADHSWGTALLCLLFAGEEGVDAGRAVQMALVHDLAEAVTGDIIVSSSEISPEMDPADKARLERQAMAGLLHGTSAARIVELWEDYEGRQSREAEFVRDMNLVDMCLQALVVQGEHRGGRPDLEEFFVSAASRIGSVTGRRLWAEADAAYRRARAR